MLGTDGEKEGEGARAKVQASWAPTAPPSPSTPAPAPAVPTLGTPSPRRPPAFSVQNGRGTGAGGREVAPSQSRGESGRCPPTCLGPRLETSPKCSEERSATLPPTTTTTTPRVLTLWKHWSVCPSVFRLHLPELDGAEAPTPGTVLQNSRPVRAPRQAPPAGLQLPAAPPPPSPGPQSPISRCILSSQGRGVQAPAPPLGSPSRCGLRAPSARSAARTAARGRPPLRTAVASGRPGRGAPGPNLPRLGALASSLSAWAAAAAAATAPGAPRGVRLRAASAGPDSRCPARAAAAAGADPQERGAAPEPRAPGQTPAYPRRLHSCAWHPTCT